MKTLASVDADTIEELQELLQSLGSVLSSVPVGVSLVDCELRFRFVNAWLARINGYTPREHLGKTVREIVPSVADALEPIYRKVLKTGRPVLDLEVRGETPADPGVHHWWVSSHYPVAGTGGQLLGVATAVQNVTRIKRAEERWRHSEATLRQVLDLVPHMIFAKDREGTILMANEAVAKAYGRTVEELMGRPHGELHVADSEVRQMLRDDQAVIDTGRPRFIPEEVFTDRNGNRRYLQTIKIPFTQHSSGEPAVMGVAVDITDRRETELELERSREQLRQLVETVQVIPWEADGETWRFTYVGPQAERILGFPAKDWYRSDFWVSTLHPDDRERAIDFCRRSSETGGEYEFEYRMLAADGRVVWIHDLVSCEVSDGRLVTLRGYMVDITPRKELEVELRRERNILRTIFDNIPMMVALVSSDGRVLKANREFERTLGWSPEEMVRLDILPRCYPDEEVRTAVLEQLSTGAADWREYRTRTRNGRTIDTSWANVRLDDNLVVSIGEDITERKRSGKAIEENRLQLERSHGEIQRLARRLLTAQEEEHRRLARELHDDFTQRLAVIAIEAGKLEARLQPQESEAAEALRTLTDHIVRLSGDLHSLSRQLHPSIIEDLGLQEALEAECQAQGRRAGLSVATDYAALPDEIPKTIALCVYRVAQEGMRNAVKHARATSFRLQLSGENGSLRMTLEDDGSGFDLEAVRGKVGMGLSSMEERVRLVGGDFQLESAEGRGTRISVSVPLGGPQTTVRASVSAG